MKVEYVLYEQLTPIGEGKIVLREIGLVEKGFVLEDNYEYIPNSFSSIEDCIEKVGELIKKAKEEDTYINVNTFESYLILPTIRFK